MTITRILALLSVVALLASLPLTAAFAQGGGEGPPVPPFTVVGNATIDGEPAMDGTMVVAMIDGEKAGSGSVMDGKFSVDVMGEQGAMIMFEFMMGEGDEAMMYKVTSDPGEVMVGMPGVPKIASLMAMGDGMMEPKPTAKPVVPVVPVMPVVPSKSVQAIVDAAIAEAMAEASAMIMENMPKDGAPGRAGRNGKDGADGADGAKGDAGARGAAGSGGSAGADGSDGQDGSDGSKGDAGPAGPAGPPGDTGGAGPQGEGGGGGILAIIALVIAIVGVLAAGGAFIAGRQSS